MGKYLQSIAFRISKDARRKRIRLFRELFDLTEETTLLDLGSQDGKHIEGIIRNTKIQPKNVFVADIDKATILQIAERYGYEPVLLGEAGQIPLDANSIDIIFCSSVIEHVTIDKEEVWTVTDANEFKRRSEERQHTFANEIRRVGRAYFVQTPNRYFPIESHTWLPFVGYLPRKKLISTIRFANRFWIFYSEPDFNLLNKSEMERLFPDSTILFEKKFGLVKSLMAVKRLEQNCAEEN